MTPLVKLANDFLSLIRSGDRILITDFHISTIIGVHDWEKKVPQDIYLTISLGVNTNKAIESDNLNDTVDYDALTKRVHSFAKTNHFELIETLADRCASIILSEFNVSDVYIQLDKPQALDLSRSVAIQIFRSK